MGLLVDGTNRQTMRNSASGWILVEQGYWHLPRWIHGAVCVQCLLSHCHSSHCHLEARAQTGLRSWSAFDARLWNLEFTEGNHALIL